MRIIVKARTSMVGSECVEEFDLDDDLTQDQIEEIAMDAAFGMIDWHYEIKGEENGN